MGENGRISRMKKKSLMAPKRRSRRPRLSRNDAQFRKGEYPLSTDFRFTPVACGKTDGETRYRLKLEGDSDSIVELTELQDEFFGTGLRVEMIDHVIGSIFDVIPRYIARTGNAVRIGNLVLLKPCVTGTIGHANDEADPAVNHVEVRATELPALRYCLKNARLVNVNGHPRGIARVIGGANPTEGIVDAMNNIFIVGYEGCEIYVPLSGAGEEGVWLETLDGQRIVRCMLSSVGVHDLIVRIPPDEPIAPGEYRIVVVTRGAVNAPEDAPIFTYSRKVSFVAGG